MAGDLIALAVVVVIGFVSHGEGSSSYLPRGLAAYVPLGVCWVGIAALLRLFDPRPQAGPGYLGRVVLAALLSALPAAILRSWILGELVQPAFVGVLAGMSALALVIWRAANTLISR